MPELRILKLGKKHYPALVDIWAEAVRATHYFLSGPDFDYFYSRIATEYLPAVELYGAFPALGPQADTCLGFMGLGEKTGNTLLHVEMLFVSPAWHGRGIGKRLLQHAKNMAAIVKVDVNEQNTGAVEFYLKQGFEIMARSPHNPGGKPYPLLHLCYSAQ